jgi:hypothetical protein
MVMTCSRRGGPGFDEVQRKAAHLDTFRIGVGVGGLMSEL